ncbi:sensor histidine kinase [Tindallia californiensis]|uniref:histidine kinase n=1 Tax=Tindallia californiensis TaxID=159292 RepID=A0A1H3J1D5_9FIRM|nr:histidine kinase [Tindallia californiensis]SDY32984.1 Signal transduction histidine kinase [Tindallia californiensis]
MAENRILDSRYMLKLIMILWVFLSLIPGESVSLIESAGFLLIVASYIFRTRFWDWNALLCFEIVIVLMLTGYSPVYLALLSVTAYDLAVKELIPIVLLLMPIGIFFLPQKWWLGYMLLIMMSVYLGFMKRKIEKNRLEYQRVYDQERKSRYLLEESQRKLRQSVDETARLTEIHERNRIAAEIHDNLGHALAGNLIQLQAADKLMEKDLKKSRELLQKTVQGLSNSLELLRNTVHNIRPKTVIGWAHFEKIIDDYQYCSVEFRHVGDIGLLTPRQVEILTSSIKEALTNTARHSDATQIKIEIEIREEIIRLFMRDNGSGCSYIHEGMGISGIRERIENAGGSFSVTPQKGFMMVGILPREGEREWE